MYHPTCQICHSPKTIKHGGRRWLCQHCRRTFRVRKKDRRDRAAIFGYVEDRSTYERLGVRWKVHRSTAYRRVQRALKKRRSLLERTRRHMEECDGVLILDGKWLHIQGKLHTCFVAWDRGFKRPIHFLLKEGGEKELWYWRLLVDLERIGYRPRAFISDGILTLKEFLAERYPNLPHQRCTVHVFLTARAKALASKPNVRGRAFVELLRLILWSRTLKEAKQRLRKLWNLKDLLRCERASLKWLWPILPECFVCRNKQWCHLKLPRSSNGIENVIGNIEARLKTRRGNKSLFNVEALINELLLHVREQTITHH